MMNGKSTARSKIVRSKKIESAENFKGLKLGRRGRMLDYCSPPGAAPAILHSGVELYQSLSSGLWYGAHWAAWGAIHVPVGGSANYHYKPGAWSNH